MPLFLKHKILFIHIPKTAGSSVYDVFANAGDPAVFTTGAINGHTAHHSSYQEYLEYRMVPHDFKVIAFMCHPVSRFVDEYNYFNTGESLDNFTERFFEGKGEWDSHNKPSSAFIAGCPNIELGKFENLEADFKRLTGLEMNVHANPSPSLITMESLKRKHVEMVHKHWKDDFKYYS